MDCELVVGVLPWALNGTLDDVERQHVREHLAHCRKCQRELAETSFAWTVHQQHIPAEVLVSIAFGRPVEAGEHSLFEKHLKACSDCAEQLEMARESRRLQPEGEAEETAQVSPLAAKKEVRWRRTPVWRYGAIAASLFLVVAAGGWLRSWQQARELRAGVTDREKALRQRLADLEVENERLRQTETQLGQQQDRSNAEIIQLQAQIKETQARVQQQQNQVGRELARVRRQGEGGGAPQVNILALDIYPVGLTQRAEGPTSNEIAIPRNVRAVTLILNSQDSSDHRSYSIEVVDSRGKTVWSARGLTRNSTSDYTISVPADYLAPGGYTINVFGQAAGRRTKVESYQIKVLKL